MSFRVLDLGKAICLVKNWLWLTLQTKLVCVSSTLEVLVTWGQFCCQTYSALSNIVCLLQLPFLQLVSHASLEGKWIATIMWSHSPTNLALWSWVENLSPPYHSSKFSPVIVDGWLSTKVTSFSVATPSLLCDSKGGQINWKKGNPQMFYLSNANSQALPAKGTWKNEAKPRAVVISITGIPACTHPNLVMIISCSLVPRFSPHIITKIESLL